MPPSSPQYLVYVRTRSTRLIAKTSVHVHRVCRGVGFKPSVLQVLYILAKLSLTTHTTWKLNHSRLDVNSQHSSTITLVTPVFDYRVAPLYESGRLHMTHSPSNVTRPFPSSSTSVTIASTSSSVRSTSDAIPWNIK